MDIAQLFAVPVDQALLVAASVGLAALIRAFTGFGFAMLVVPVFSFFLTPGDAVVLSAVLAFLLGLLSYSSWWGLFPVAPARPMVAGSVIGTAIGVWFLASLSVAEFQLWIGISVVIASMVLARSSPVNAPPQARSADNWCGFGSDERRIRYSRAAGHPLCRGDPLRAGEVEGVSDDVLLVFERRVAGHVRCGGVDFTTTFSVVMGCPASHVVGNQAGNWAFARYAGAAYRPVVVGLCILIGLSISAKAVIWG